MFERCFDEIQGILGRELEPKERESMRRQFEDEYLGQLRLNVDESTAVTQAISKVRERLEFEAAQAQLSSVLNAQKLAKLTADLPRLKQEIGARTLHEVVLRMLVSFEDAKMTDRSVYNRAQVHLARHVTPTMAKIAKALGSSYLTLTENAKANRAFIHYLYDPSAKLDGAEYDGIDLPAIREAAGMWTKLQQAEVQRLRDAGADVMDLDTWRVPQVWEALKASAKGRAKFVEDFMPRIDWQKVRNKDGTHKTADERQSFLEEAWLTLASDGANKDPEGSTFADIAQRMKFARQMHIKDAEGWLYLQKEYGGSGVKEMMDQHVRQTAITIGAVDVFGTDMDATMKAVFEMSGEHVRTLDPALQDKMVDMEKKDAQNARLMFAHLFGTWRTVHSKGFAEVMQGLRNLQLLKLAQSWTATLIGDIPTTLGMLRANKASGLEQFAQRLALLNPKNEQDRLVLEQAGLLAEVMGNHVSRYGEEMLATRGWTKGIGDATMKLSLTPFLTRSSQHANRLVLMSAMARKVARMTFADATDPANIDGRILRGAGVTPEDWAVWRMARMSELSGGRKALTPAAIDAIPDAELLEAGIHPSAKNAAAERLLSYVLNEDAIGITVAGPRETALVRRRMDMGTAKDELYASFLVFKSFPLAIYQKHFGRFSRSRAFSKDGTLGNAGVYAYMIGFVVMSTLLGALLVQARQIRDGKDPRNMNSIKFWGTAAASGGGLGFAGDVAAAATTDANQLLQTLAGPLMTDAAKGLALAGSSASKAVTEEQAFRAEQAGGEAVKLARSYMPVVGLTYVKPFLDSLLFSEVQEWASPGYAERAKARMYQDYQQERYWDTGEMLPERAPDLSKAWQE